MIKKSVPAASGKSSDFRQTFFLFVFCGIVLSVMWLTERRPHKDIILFIVLVIGAGVLFKVIDKFRSYQDLPLLFKRLIFYSVLIPILSIIIPLIDVLIMSGATIAFELETIFKNEKKE